MRKATFQQLYRAADESPGDPTRRSRERGGLPCVGLTCGSLSAGARPVLPALGRQGEPLHGATPRALLRHPGLGTAGAGPGTVAAFSPPIPPKRPVLTGLRGNGFSDRQLQKDRTLVPWEGGGKGYRSGCEVRRGSPTKCGENRLGRQEPRCRVKCVCPGPGSGC